MNGKVIMNEFIDVSCSYLLLLDTDSVFVKQYNILVGNYFIMYVLIWFYKPFHSCPKTQGRF